MNPTNLLTGLGAAVAAEPTLGGASGTGQSAGGGDLFLALVAGLLQGDATAGTSGQVGPSTTAPTDGDAVAPVSPAPADSPPAAPTDTDGTDTDTATDQPVPAAPAAPVTLALAMTPLVVQAAVSAATTGTAADPGPRAPVAGPEDAVVPVPAATGTDVADGSAKSGGDAPTPPATDATTQPTAAGPVAPRPDGRADLTQATATPTAPVTTAAVAPTVAPAPVAATTSAADLPRVTEQVFPEVLRATTANAGNGTSRVTIKLNPESLGEVRVVLTQRRGELEVSLAGGADARRALTEGAPELRRLLESVGRSDSRILIRDLPTGPTPPVSSPTGPSTRTDVSTDLAGGAWSGAGRPGGEPAPDRETPRHHPGSTTATDGTPSATTGSRPTTTESRGRTGLDLSM